MSKSLWTALVVASVAVAFLVDAGHQASPSPEGDNARASVVVVGSATKVRPSSRPPGSRRARLSAARNEFESFQVVIAAGAERLEGVSVSLARPLTGRAGSIPRGHVTIYREAYYRVRSASDLEGATGMWPDALIPAVDPFYRETRNAFPIDVPAGQSRAVWVDVLVPRDAGAGRYTGSLLVRGQNLRARIGIDLNVLDLVLPSTPTIASAFGMFYTPCLGAVFAMKCSAESEWRLRALFARAALDNRISISTPHYGSIASVSQQAHFRRHVLPLLQGRARTRLQGARLTSVRVDQGESLRSWRREAERGGFGRRAFVYACDEPGADELAWKQCVSAAAAARSDWPDVSILVTASLQEAEAFGTISSVDTLVPVLNALDDKPGASEYTGLQRPKYDSFLQTPRKRLWVYTSCQSHGCSAFSGTDSYYAGWPSYTIDAPASQARAMGWLSFVLRTSGELYFAVDRKLATAWHDQYAFGGNGDGTLFYPGKPSIVGGRRPIPIESIRLKLIRDGYEDYEYLALLARRGRGAGAAAVAQKLFPAVYRTTVSDHDLQAARRQLVKLVTGLRRRSST